MARRNASLKPHLNQIRTWVGEGVTDIWIAHQLGSTPASIAAFRRQHGLTRSGGEAAPVEPAVAAAGVATAAPLGDQDTAAEAADAVAPEAGDDAAADDAAEDGAPAKRRRRGRRGGRGRGRGKQALTARVEYADGELVVRIDAAALTGATAEAWAQAETAALTVTEAGLQLAPEPPAGD
ncbi:MAG: hypothetical protein ACKOD0_06160 [Actinomycetota bacterium]